MFTGVDRWSPQSTPETHLMPNSSPVPRSGHSGVVNRALLPSGRLAICPRSWLEAPCGSASHDHSQQLVHTVLGLDNVLWPFLRTHMVSPGASVWLSPRVCIFTPLRPKLSWRFRSGQEGKQCTPRTRVTGSYTCVHGRNLRNAKAIHTNESNYHGQTILIDKFPLWVFEDQQQQITYCSDSQASPVTNSFFVCLFWWCQQSSDCGVSVPG